MSQDLEVNEPQRPCLVTVAEEAVLTCMDTCLCVCARTLAVLGVVRVQCP